METSDALHLVVFPYARFSHIHPFLQLSKLLAQLGHRVSFISTPISIQIVTSAANSAVSPLIHPIPLASPTAEDNPDALQDPFTTFLRTSSTPPPDWILFDGFYHWVPRIAAELSIPSCYVIPIGAAANAFMWPFFALAADGQASRVTVERLTAPPDWIPFPTSMSLRRHEARQVLNVFFEPSFSGPTNGYRVGTSIRDCDFIAVESCAEFEPEYLALLPRLYGKPVFPLGHFAAIASDDSTNIGAGPKNWHQIFEWLDKREAGSVVYVAFGSEAVLSKEQAHEIARGLELSELPYLWALRSSQGEPDGLLPEGFEDRTRSHGLVFKGWAPQVRILGHPSLGGFLTHCGWNSVLEVLQFGLALVLLPWFHDQWFNARLLKEKKVGVEVPRNEEDGSFVGEEIGKALRLVMADKEGEVYRATAKELGAALGSKEVHGRHVKNFVRYLKDNRSRGQLHTIA